MTTALQLLTTAGKKFGLSADDVNEPEVSASGLAVLNSMLDSWQIERLLVYQIVQGSHTWPAATTSRTIGSGGNFAAQRPVKIESAYLVDGSSQWYPLTVLEEREEYDSIPDKTAASTLASRIFMDAAYPLGVIYLHPVPSASITLKLNTWQTLQSFAALTTDLALPPGYQRMIEFNLAVEWHSDYPSIPLPASVIKSAIESKANIKSLNAPSMVASVGAAVASLGGGGRYNIYTDTVH